ncbi:MAG TPA: UDP-4-amino-4,6-dideoxy-N-acetyl-beta-L-altrosamine transaminase [Syntrophobacteraceae bacterium]|nr:UDP-4-amino-4,6-dideoxy-N-acetyl-beta-L-altrosamine transaminase [Syntrophobacteraceae bacterium]
MSSNDRFLPFAQPDLDGSELKEIGEALASGWVTTGPKVRQFESEFAALVGARHAIAVNSCTAAMHLALEALGVKRGDEVITSPYTFAATAEVIRYFDAHPVFVDVEPRTFHINPSLIERAITDRTKAIIPVHMAGLPVDMDPLQEIARRHELPVIEDAAHTFPSTYKGRQVGSLGEMTCFSFYATKTITTGEGGMITTDNDQWAERCRIMCLHGISKDAWKRYTAEGSWYYEIIAPGFKYNMTDIAAAMGLAQLAKADRMWRRRREIAHRYNEAFQNAQELQLPFDRSDCQHAWHLYMLRLNLERLRLDRGEFFEELKRRNIGASVHFIPLHVHPYYRQVYGYEPEDFPVAYREYQRAISLPIYSKMNNDDVRDVIAAVLEIVAKHRA